MELSDSGKKSGWRDYAASEWDQRKPITWLHDWDFWKYCADKFAQNGPILELACGNGRITRQLALAGFDVVAVDINPHFLNRAVDTIPTELRSKANFHLQDVVYLALDGQFHLAIMADWAFPAILTQTDQRQFLTRLHHHLLPGGHFAFNTPFATTRQLGLISVDEKLVWEQDQNRTLDALTQVETNNNGPYPIRLRHNTLEDIRLLGELAGFEIAEKYGNVDRRPLRGVEGDDLTLILRKIP